MYGARISLGAAVLIVGGAATAGLVMGLASAHYRGVVDEVLMRVTDVLLAFPGVRGPSPSSACSGAGVSSTGDRAHIFIVPGFARLVRAASLAESARD